jgi:hypothetical protein
MLRLIKPTMLRYASYMYIISLGRLYEGRIVIFSSFVKSVFDWYNSY